MTAKSGYITEENMALATDRYQITMAAAYHDHKMKDATATFELFIRQLPEKRDYLITAGLEQAVHYLTNLHFTEKSIAYFRTQPTFKNVSEEFWNYLKNFRFTGQLRAIPEGTLAFANEPIISITAPIIEAQLVETYLLSIINSQTNWATKSARIKQAAAGKPFTDFGMRRGHGPQAGVYAARAAYIGGADGTSCDLAGQEFGIPVQGTTAHSWIMAHEKEENAFEKYAYVFPDTTIALIDTYDAIKGTRKAIFALTDKLKGVRLDSGSLDEIIATTHEMRRMLDMARLKKTKILISGDLNEDKIRYLESKTNLINAYGIGTELATVKDSPALGGVYKLVEFNGKPRMKLSAGKATLPGKKQVFRFYHDWGLNHLEIQKDILGLADEPMHHAHPTLVRPLLEPIISNGLLIEGADKFFDIQKAKQNAHNQLFCEYTRGVFKGVQISDRLQELTEKCRTTAVDQ